MKGPRCATGGLITVAIPLCLGVAACRGAGVERPVVPTPSTGTIADACPDGELAVRGDGAPTFIELVNEGAEPVRFSLDRCVGHRLLGEVAGGASTKVLLPEAFVMYPEGLRVNAYDLSSRVRLGVFAVEGAIADTAVLRLSGASQPLPDDSSAGGVDYSRFGRTEAGMLADVPQVSIFAINTPGVLSWQCLESGLTLVLATGGRIPEAEATVTLSRGGRTFGEAENLDVIEGISDSVILPAEWAETIARVFSTSATIALDVPADARITVPHHFHGAGVSDPLEALPCLQTG